MLTQDRPTSQLIFTSRLAGVALSSSKKRKAMKKIFIIKNEQHTLLPSQSALVEKLDGEITPIDLPATGLSLDGIQSLAEKLGLAAAYGDYVVFVSPLAILASACVLNAVHKSMYAGYEYHGISGRFFFFFKGERKATQTDMSVTHDFSGDWQLVDLYKIC